MTKRTSTLIDSCEALTAKACALVDARDAGDPTAAAKLEAVRVERDAIRANVRARATGKSYRHYARHWLRTS